MEFAFVVILGLAILFLIILAKTAVVVPQQHAYVVERLGRYSGTLGAGLHILLPFVDMIRYRHSLKEQVVDFSRQICTTKDDRQLQVDGILQFKIVDPEKASYAVQNYFVALMQLTQVALRQEIGKLEENRAREDWTPIAAAVTSEVTRKAEPWGLAVLGFELENMTFLS